MDKSQLFSLDSDAYNYFWYAATIHLYFSRISDLTFEATKIVCRRYSNYGIAALPGIGRIFKNSISPRFNAISGECSFASRRSFLRDTKCYTIAHDRAEENINGRLTYPSIVLVINDLSRSMHTDTRIAASTDRRTKICYCTRRRVG